jgi:hypothetical protein
MNERRGEASITLGGTEYTLRPTFEALSEMESKTGAGIIKLAFKFLPEIQGGTLDYTLRDMVAVLAAGIKGAGGAPPANLGALVAEAGPMRVGREVAAFLINALQGGQSGNAEAAKE